MQILKPPVLSGTCFAEIAAQLDESSVPHLGGLLLPAQDLINLVEDQQGTVSVEFGRHEQTLPTPQAGQANQGHLLLGGERALSRSRLDPLGTDLGASSSRSRSGETGSHCGEGTRLPGSGKQ